MGLGEVGVALEVGVTVTIGVAVGDAIGVTPGLQWEWR